ncbi:MAG TPA: DEAD/DEAH box helicase [Rhabdochlamydiaceae bacterium]
MSFNDFISDANILKALEEEGLNVPTPIQAKAIPKIIQGFDLRASAQTGTGKTVAFLLPALMRLTVPSPVQGHGPRILILVPTRELAMQVAVESAKYSKYISRAKTVCIYGGAPYPIQNRELSRPYDILVATPGRLIDHCEQGRINFSRLEMFILDEADRMLDMGFIKPVEHIAASLPKTRQTLMFSATLKGLVLNLSNRLLTNPMEIHVTPEKTNHENIEQKLLHVDNIDHKYRLLDHILNDPVVNQTIIFTATKRQADQLASKLYKDGRPVAPLHGGMTQKQRTRTIKQLRDGDIRILVATDVAARGIDVQTVSHVINFDLPRCTEDYVHRIGRTGRAGATGTALAFAASRDSQLVRDIEKFIGRKITPHTIPGMEAKMKPQQSFEQAPRGQAPRGQAQQRPAPKGQYPRKGAPKRKFGGTPSQFQKRKRY